MGHRMRKPAKPGAGYRIRTGDLLQNFTLNVGDVIEITAGSENTENQSVITVNYRDMLKDMKPGDRIGHIRSGDTDCLACDHSDENRRQEPMPNHLGAQRPTGLANGMDRKSHRQRLGWQRRVGNDPRRAILNQRADRRQRVAKLKTRNQRRHKARDFGSSDGKISLTGIEHRMSKREHPVSGDRGDCADRLHGDIAADQLDGNGAAWFEIPWCRCVCRR